MSKLLYTVEQLNHKRTTRTIIGVALACAYVPFNMFIMDRQVWPSFVHDRVGLTIISVLFSLFMLSMFMFWLYWANVRHEKRMDQAFADHREQVLMEYHLNK